MRSGRLDVSVAILALALPFALPVLIVAWMHPDVVAAPGSASVASVAPYERPTANATATIQPAGAVSPTRAPDASPATAPAPVPASDIPATGAPASTSSPALGPTLTQPPTATVAGPGEVAADPSVLTGLLLLGGLGVVVVTMGATGERLTLSRTQRFSAVSRAARNASRSLRPGRETPVPTRPGPRADG